MGKQKRYKTKEGTYAKDRKYGEFKSSRSINYTELKIMPEKVALQKLGSKIGSMIKSKDIPINVIKAEDMGEAILELKREYASQFNKTTKQSDEWYNRQLKEAQKLKKQGIKAFANEERLVQYMQAQLITNKRNREKLLAMVDEYGKDIDVNVYQDVAHLVAERDWSGKLIMPPVLNERDPFRVIPQAYGEEEFELGVGSWTAKSAQRVIVEEIRKTAPEYYEVRIEQAKLNYIKALDSVLVYERSILPSSKVQELMDAILSMSDFKFQDMWNSVNIQDYYDIAIMEDKTKEYLRELSYYTGVKFRGI